jgi:DNA-binding winged helix-turn-helix (wHTH) protein/TolB-like protein
MPTSRRVRFGEFEADLVSGELWRNGEALRVQDLPSRLLAALLERPGELVTRAELGARIWGSGTFVDFDAGLNTAVAKLREAFGDSADAPRYIETVPKRGYRFIATIEPVAPIASVAPIVPPAAVAATAAQSRALLLAVAGFVAVLAVAVATVFIARAGSDQGIRVAVALFDNETGDASFDRLAQLLTDSTVITLTDNRALAVIGNAAVLRTDRPFRDLVKIRETLGAELVVIGQVQRTEAGIRALTHLIRMSDQAHVWVKATALGESETQLEREVTAAIDGAIRDAVLNRRGGDQTSSRSAER